jgi:hypothetical protein
MDSTIVKEFDSKQELKRYLNQHHALNVLVGEDAECPRKFYSIVATSQPTPAVGVISSGHGTKPALVHLARGGRVLVGHDSKLTELDSISGQVVFVLPLNGVFFEFLDCGEAGQIAIHELGAVKIDAFGKRQWTIDTDVVADFEVDETGQLKLRTMDGEYKTIDIHSGKEE